MTLNMTSFCTVASFIKALVECGECRRTISYIIFYIYSFVYSWKVELLGWICCLTSQLTIFQSYMWQHIDVQADWRRSWTYGRAPNAIDISQGSLTCPSQHRHGTTLFIWWFRHTAPFSRLLRSRWGYGGHILDLTPQALMGVHEKYILVLTYLVFLCIMVHFH